MIIVGSRTTSTSVPQGVRETITHHVLSACGFIIFAISDELNGSDFAWAQYLVGSPSQSQSPTNKNSTIPTVRAVRAF